MRLVELAVRDGHQRAAEGVLHRLVRRPALPAPVRVVVSAARLTCAVVLWWLLDRTLDVVF